MTRVHLAVVISLVAAVTLFFHPLAAAILALLALVLTFDTALFKETAP